MPPTSEMENRFIVTKDYEEGEQEGSGRIISYDHMWMYNYHKIKIIIIKNI